MGALADNLEESDGCRGLRCNHCIKSTLPGYLRETLPQSGQLRTEMRTPTRCSPMALDWFGTSVCEWQLETPLRQGAPPLKLVMAGKWRL